MDDYMTVTDPDNPILFYELNMARVDYVGGPPLGQEGKIAIYFSGRAEPLLLPRERFWFAYDLWRRRVPHHLRMVPGEGA